MVFASIRRCIPPRELTGISVPRTEGWPVGREGTRTREREFVVLPDQFKRLRTGEAVLILPGAKTPGEVVRVLAPVKGRERG